MACQAFDTEKWCNFGIKHQPPDCLNECDIFSVGKFDFKWHKVSKNPNITMFFSPSASMCERDLFVNDANGKNM